jgi:hypothetical protein
MNRKRKRTPEERAADRARSEDLDRRLQAMIERYRRRAEERRRAEGDPAT